MSHRALIHRNNTGRLVSLTLTSVALLAVTLLLTVPAGASDLHPAIDAVVEYDTEACTWGPPIKESSGIEYECPGGTVMAGMKHSGDENGNTHYQCCPLTPQPVKKSVCAWSNAIRESNSNYFCPAWQAMTGREHSGDENGSTKYYCCNLDNPSGQMWTDDTTCEWVGPQKQSKSDLTCPDGKVMTGRSHQGDENGDTQIYCCSFFGND